MQLVDVLIFASGLVSSFIVGGNNNATALGILISTRAIKRRLAYLLNAIASSLGVFTGYFTMSSSVYGLFPDDNSFLVKLLILSMLLSTVISFYYLNRSGIPSSLSQMLYPSAVVLAIISHSRFNWSKFIITAISWAISPTLAIVASLGLYYLLVHSIISERKVIRQMKVYKSLITFSALFTSFVTGANAIGLIVSAGLISFPSIVVIPSYALATALGIYLTSTRVSITVGFRITRLGYIASISALTGGNIISEIFTILGIPISITQTITGGIIGLSFRSMGTDVKEQLSKIGKGWVTSPTLSILVSLAIFGILRSIIS
ncbi:MAG: inorganic phosphate transporter [Sulfolobaceae archaeon]|nr:inorganic phosphate transporter [Sulfolobaceae archaeon]